MNSVKTVFRVRALLPLILIVAALIFAGYAAFSGRFAPEEKRKFPRCSGCNVVMISLSNVGAGRMSLYGYKRLTTPRIDEWSKNAVVFNEVFVPGSWTLPVATSLFTSLYPYSHGVLDRQDKFKKEVKTFPEILADYGYKTAAFTGGLDYSKDNPHMRGFAAVDEAVEGMPADFLTLKKEMGSSLQKARVWMRKNRDSNFFVFVHGYDAHCPFIPPARFSGAFSSKTPERKISIDGNFCYRGYETSSDGTVSAVFRRIYDETRSDKNRKELQSVLRGIPWEKTALAAEDIAFLEDRYDETVLSVDALVGDFLDSLDPAFESNTIFVIFSDHGETFARNGRFGRGGAVRGTFYDDVMRVPLIMKAPGMKPQRVNGLAQIIDVMPALLDALNLKDPSEKFRQGKNLKPLITEGRAINEYVFAGSDFNTRQHTLPFTKKTAIESVRNSEWKLIKETSLDLNGLPETFELYNLKNDPKELNNVIDDYADVAAELKRMLKNWEGYVKGF